MKSLDRWVAFVFLVISLVYGYAALSYPLLPFERNMAFLPNTLPKGLSVLGVIVSLVIILSPRRAADDDLGGLDRETLRSFEIGKAVGLVIAMVLYALLLRPAGFLPATFLFIVGSALVLGERKFLVLVPVAAITAAGIWYLVQETLGIFLRPWPLIGE